MPALWGDPFFQQFKCIYSWPKFDISQSRTDKKSVKELNHSE